MTEILYDRFGRNEEQLREHYRGEMNRLFGAVSPQKLAEAMGLVRATYSSLKPFQPLDLGKLQTDLAQMGLKDVVTGEDIDVLTSSHMLDRRKWDLVMAEWSMK